MNEDAPDKDRIQQRLEEFDSQIRDLEREMTELRGLLGIQEEAPEQPVQPPPESEPLEPIAQLPTEPTAQAAPAPPKVKAETPRIPASRLPDSPVELAPTASKSTLDIEELLSGRVMAWVGGLAILVGSLFFLSLAFSRGWIGPETRVIIGLLAGAAMVTGGALFFERRERLFGHVLLAVGLGVFNLALFAAERLYELIPYEIALAGTFVAASVGAFVAIRARSQIVAVYGLLPAHIAPVLFEADPTGVTIAYLGILLAGTAAISLYRTWTWLPLLSLLFTFFQLYIWLDEESPRAILGLLVIAGYWLIHTLGSGGEDFRTVRNRLRPSSTITMILNTLIAGLAGAILFNGVASDWSGLYLIGLAAIHLPLAGYLLYRNGHRHPFGMLTLGLGLVVAAVAIPVQFNGEAVPVAWAALAVVMVWLYGRLRNEFSLGAGGVLGALAIWHLVLFDYPLGDFLSRTIGSGTPFINGSGAVLGTLLLAAAASAYLARSRYGFNAAILLGAGLLAYSLPYEITDGWLIAGWASLALALIAVNRVEPTGHPLYAVAGLGLSAFALLVTLARTATPSRLRVSAFNDIDHALLWSDATLTLASLTITLIVAWRLHRREYPFYASFILAAGVSLVVYLLSIGLVDEFQKRVDLERDNLNSLREQAQVGLSVLWTTFGVASFVLGVIFRRIGMRVFGLALLGLAIVKVFIVDLASLDASYRVISFIALGILLLLASYLYQRIMAGTKDDDGVAVLQ